MKNCSYCGRESDDSAMVCFECRTEFPVPAGPEEDDSALKDPAYTLRVLAEYSTVVEANMLKTHLEAAGVEACVPEEFSPQLFWYCIPSVLEAVTVRVAEKDYEAAKKLLDEFNAAEVAPPPPPRPPGQPPALPPSARS